jgi:hypothetical protein
VKELLSTLDSLILAILAVVRGVCAETLSRYRDLRDAGGAEAIRKRLERLAQRGYVANSSLPSGRRIYRLSHRGVRVTGAPSAFATNPSANILAEMVSVSACAWKSEEFDFLTLERRDSLLRQITGKSDHGNVSGRLLLRKIKLEATSDHQASEWHLHYWLAELRTADELTKRINVILQNLSRTPIFEELIAAGIFGVTIACPSPGAKASLEAKSFGVETTVVVIEELQHLVR